MGPLLLVAKIVAVITVSWVIVIVGGAVILGFAMERMNRAEIEGPRPR